MSRPTCDRDACTNESSVAINANGGAVILLCINHAPADAEVQS